MSTELPQNIQDFESKYPEIWKAFAALAESCHERGGPLDEKSRRIAKLGIAIGMQHEGALHSAVRQALAAGVTPDEILHTALLSVTTIGWPRAYAAFRWMSDIVTEAK